MPHAARRGKRREPSLSPAVVAAVAAGVLLAAVLLAGPGHEQQATTAGNVAQSRALLAAGDGHLRNGRPAEALVSFDGALAAAASRDAIAQAGGYKAVSLRRLGRFAEALSAHDDVLRASPRDSSVYMKGALLNDLDRHDEAVSAFQLAAAAMPPGMAEPHASLCTSLLGSAKALGLTRDGSDALTAAQTTRFSEAIESCDTALAAPPHPKDPDRQLQRLAHQSRAYSLTFLGRLAEARTAYATALHYSKVHLPLTEQLASESAAAALGLRGRLHILWPSDSRNAPNAMDTADETSTDAEALWSGTQHLPVWVASGGAATASMNEDLGLLVRRMMEEDPRGVNVSNVGGWQSGKSDPSHPDATTTTLLDQRDGRGQRLSSANRLRSQILAQVHDFLRALKLSRKLTAWVSIGDSWANVNQNGAWNVPHSHAPTALAGCYYVDDGGQGDLGEGGGVAFLSPNEPRVPLETDGTVLVPPITFPNQWTNEALGRAHCPLDLLTSSPCRV